jgi:hypothetical protein
LQSIVNNAWGYYSFNATTQAWVSENATANMQKGIGFVVSAPLGHSNGSLSVDINKDFDKFNAGNIPVNVVINGSGATDDDDWNLLGNPYPSAIDFDQFVNDNSKIQGSYYLWSNCENSSVHTSSGYTIYTVGTGSTSSCSGTGATANRYIASTQAFFVEANESGEILFKNSQRVSAHNDNFISRSTQTGDKLWLDLLENNNFNQILIGFNPNATDLIDRLYDARAMDNGSGQNFYSFINSEHFAIQSFSELLSEDKTIPLGFETAHNSTLTIHLNRFEGQINTKNVYLKDLQLHIIHDLKQSDYSFNSASGQINDRFELLITDNLANINQYFIFIIKLLFITFYENIINYLQL